MLQTSAKSSAPDTAAHESVPVPPTPAPLPASPPPQAPEGLAPFEQQEQTYEESQYRTKK
ncbi:MAG: hypothetical protein ACO4AI_12670 [Prochlorothrix sp.]